MNLEDPLITTYAIAASLMILKMMAQAWITVYRMLKVKAGFRSPEDLRAGLCNPTPLEGEQQIAPNEYVERSRRMHNNDLENIPAFLIAGLLFVLTSPPLWLAQVLLYGFVATRLCHFVAYFNAWSHEMRATFFTIGSMIVMGMCGYCLWFVATL